MSSCSAWRWVTSAMGPPSATAALSALTLFSRPTWSGTIISGKMTVSRSATSGSSRGPVDGGGLLVDRGGRSLGHWGSPRSAVVRPGSAAGVVGLVVRSFGIEGFEDPSAEALLEFEEEPDAGEVHAALPGQVADPGEPTDVVLAVEPDVRGRPGRAEQAFVLVDAEGPRMGAHEGRGHADDVDGTFGIAFWADGGHRKTLLAVRCEDGFAGSVTTPVWTFAC